MQTFYHFFDKLFQVDKFTYKKMHFLEKKMLKNFVSSKKSSTFAAGFQNKHLW